MQLSKAFEMAINYYGKAHTIRVDQDQYICLTDMVKYFPTKRIRDWEKLKSTHNFMSVVEDHLKSDDSRRLEIIKKKSGRYEGGTYAHEIIALEFATWLSPEFKLNVYLAYQQGSQRQYNWNIKRILASENYKLMPFAVKNAHDPVSYYHFSNEARMLNRIVFNKECKINPRESASSIELDNISYLESRNATLIELGMEYSERKEILGKLFINKNIKKNTEFIEMNNE